MAKNKMVQMPSGKKVEEEWLLRTVVEGEGDTLDYMALKDLDPLDLKYVFSRWIDQVAGR